jgi:hypothetical protein
MYVYNSSNLAYTVSVQWSLWYSEVIIILYAETRSVYIYGQWDMACSIICAVGSSWPDVENSFICIEMTVVKVGFEILTAVVMKSEVFWYITEVYRILRWFHADLIFSNLMMEAICCSKT